MKNTLTPYDLRRWAIQCRAQADNPRTSAEERSRLTEMVAALNVLAEQQDWLDGKRYDDSNVVPLR